VGEGDQSTPVVTPTQTLPHRGGGGKSALPVKGRCSTEQERGRSMTIAWKTKGRTAMWQPGPPDTA
jgi:hypothetical protein